MTECNSNIPHRTVVRNKKKERPCGRSTKEEKGRLYMNKYFKAVAYVVVYAALCGTVAAALDKLFFPESGDDTSLEA